jgi:Flp pilus assembly protein TadD
MPDLDQVYDEAIALKEAGQMDQAVARLEDLVRQAPDHALGHSALSVFYSQMERFDEAVEHADKVCQLEPDDPFSFVAKSLICQKAGLLAEAEQASWEARRRQMQARPAEQAEE